MRALLACLATATAAAMLAGCAPLGRDYVRTAPVLPERYAGAAPDEASAPGVVSAHWWRLYDDARLDGLVEAALARNPGLHLAAAQVEEAEAVLREALALLAPQIDLGAAAARSRVSRMTMQPVPAGVPAVGENYRLALSSAYEIDFWGRLRRGAEAARTQLLASRYGRDVVALSLAGTVAQSWFALRSLDAQIALTRESLEVREASLALARARARGGLVPDLDVYQAEGARADAAVQLNELQRQRAALEHLLGALSGQLDLRVPPGELGALPAAPLPPPGLPSALLERRPDVRQAEAGLQAANARIGVARAAMMPSISLTGTLGGQSGALADLLAGGARIWSIGFGLSLPIFDAGRLQARLEQAEARERQALAAYQRAAETAYREVADALVDNERGAQAERELQLRVLAARNTSRLARTRYEAGYSGYLEVLDALRSQNDAELALIRARQARLTYSVNLVKALGGGWVDDAALEASAEVRNGERSRNSSR